MDENLTKTESNGNRTTAQVRQIKRKRLKGRWVLQNWAFIAADGGIKSAKLLAESSGDSGACDEYGHFWHVEHFWTISKMRSRWRALVLDVVANGHTPTKREKLELVLFEVRFSRWYQEHPLTYLAEVE